MKKFFIMVAVLSSLSFAHAQGYIVNLDGLQSVPPNGSPAFGSGSFNLSSTNLSVVTGSYQDLLGGATAVTLNNAGPGVNGPLVSSLTLDTPGAASGTYSGTVGLTALQIDQLNAGNFYVNIRSQVFPSGEIRGQLMLVPEPATMALWGIGGLALLAMKRRKC